MTMIDAETDLLVENLDEAIQLITSAGRFGVFQLHVQGVPLGDGTTTAWYPHYEDLEGLAVLARRPGSQRRRRLALGDTFDHLELYLEMTQGDIVFTFTTRPADQWGSPPPWAPQPDNWMRLSIPRPDFLPSGRPPGRNSIDYSPARTDLSTFGDAWRPARQQSGAVASMLANDRAG